MDRATNDACPGALPQDVAEGVAVDGVVIAFEEVLMTDRYSRQVALFGNEGQQRIRNTRVVVAGAGGIGSQLIQQLSLLGVGGQIPIDFDGLDETSRNRLIGALNSDPLGMLKVEIAMRTSKSINPTVEVEVVASSLVTPEGFAAVRSADWVFGGFDRDGVRQILLELCAAYEKPYVDIASEVIRQGDGIEYGGRIVTMLPGRPGCLSCLGELDRDEVARDLAGPALIQARRDLYGVPADPSDGSGPSVACVNGVVTCLAVVEFMATVTGLRTPNLLQRYRGSSGRVTVVTDEPSFDCYYCVGLRGKGDGADVERYIRDGVGAWL